MEMIHVMFNYSEFKIDNILSQILTTSLELRAGIDININSKNIPYCGATVGIIVYEVRNDIYPTKGSSLKLSFFYRGV